MSPPTKPPVPLPASRAAPGVSNSRAGGGGVSDGPTGTGSGAATSHYVGRGTFPVSGSTNTTGTGGGGGGHDSGGVNNNAARGNNYRNSYQASHHHSDNSSSNTKGGAASSGSTTTSSTKVRPPGAGHPRPAPGGANTARMGNGASSHGNFTIDGESMDVHKVKALVPELRHEIKRRDKIIEQYDSQVRMVAIELLDPA